MVVRQRQDKTWQSETETKRDVDVLTLTQDTTVRVQHWSLVFYRRSQQNRHRNTVNKAHYILFAQFTNRLLSWCYAGQHAGYCIRSLSCTLFLFFIFVTAMSIHTTEKRTEKKLHATVYSIYGLSTLHKAINYIQSNTRVHPIRVRRAMLR